MKEDFISSSMALGWICGESGSIRWSVYQMGPCPVGESAGTDRCINALWARREQHLPGLPDAPARW
jgi:hypothetical protein